MAQSLFLSGNWKNRSPAGLRSNWGLITEEKDSTGSAFIGELKFRDFLARYLLDQTGSGATVDGQEIGQHDGLMYHTLGQRKGLKISRNP